MPRLSDLIEVFIKELLQDATECGIEIQRNELASYFHCAPSQINYVLSTRFTVDKGYLIESRRGGGGHIKIAKMDMDQNLYLRSMIEQMGHSISKMKAHSMILILKEEEMITNREAMMMKAAISDRSIKTPMNIKDEIRANILKSMMVAIFNDYRRG